MISDALRVFVIACASADQHGLLCVAPTQGQLNLPDKTKIREGMPKALWLQDDKPSINLEITYHHFSSFLKSGRHFEEMTKTRRANPLIINLEQFYNSRKRPPKGWSRAPSPPRVRVSLSVVLGQ